MHTSREPCWVIPGDDIGDTGIKQPQRGVAGAGRMQPDHRDIGGDRADQGRQLIDGKIRWAMFGDDQQRAALDRRCDVIKRIGVD